MKPSFQRLGLLLLLVALLGGSGVAQRALNRERVGLGLTRGESLGSSAPPALVFATVALGGFRGLIANALWIRAMDLQEQDKFFEKVQLADWITKLQPRFITVWVFQAWDMAYNISVKFNSPADRWLWVQRGIELLRDQALKYNPDEPLLYRELAGLFHHKMGMDMDDAHRYYKNAWAEEMDRVLNGTNYLALLNPQTDGERARARLLREHYKLDPAIMREVDETYGPLEWRLPESHAVYWSLVGFKKAQQKDLINLRRVIYQPLQLAFQRGRLIKINTAEGPVFSLGGPNLAMIPSANKAYETMAAEDPEYRDNIRTAHRNFLKDAVYFLYTHNRRAEAAEWFRYLLEKYPDAQFSDARREDKANARIADLSLDDYAAARVTEDIAETSPNRMESNLQGLMVKSFYYLANDLDDDAVGHERLAQIAYNRFMREVRSSQTKRIGLRPFDEIKRDALRIFEANYSPDMVARVRTRLGLPPVSEAVAPSREAVGSLSSTNASGATTR